MHTNKLTTLAQLIADDGHACTFQSLGNYRSALLKEIAQASAAPEQEPAGQELPFYLRAKLPEVERLRAENEEWAPTMQRLGDENQVLRSQLEAATQRADAAERELVESDLCVVRALSERDAAERKLGDALAMLREWSEMFHGSGISGGPLTALRNKTIDLLSASSEPAVTVTNMGGYDFVEAGKPAKGGDGEAV